MNFQELAKIDVSKHTEKKNGLTYLSWAWAVDQLQRLDPEANWSYAEPKVYGETLMVFCTVKAFGRERTAQLPVMDYKNRAIPNPDAMQVNTAMQRALAKAIALHGIGLYIYAGEDVPAEAPTPLPASAKSVPQAEWDELSAEDQKWLQGIADKARTMIDAGDVKGAVAYCEGNNLEHEQSVALWSRFTSTERTAMKKITRPEPQPEKKAA